MDPEFESMYEFEDELEGEYENEFEGEYEDEFEFEGEFESEFEFEDESEEFFRALAQRVRQAGSAALRAGRSQVQALRTEGTPQRRVALQAARGAIKAGLTGLGGLIGGRLGAPGAGAAAGGVVGDALSTLVPEKEWEYEGEYEEEASSSRAYTEAVMEHMGHAAAEAESEEESEAFIGALVPLAARLIPAAASSVMRAAPGLVQGAARVARTLRQNPQTRPLVRTVPNIVKRTVAQVAQQARRAGAPVPPQQVVRTLGRQTAKVLSNPTACVHAYQRSKALDKRLHRSAAAAARPAARRPAPAAARRAAAARPRGRSAFV